MSTTTHTHDPLTWKQADIDVHVATSGGEFAGFVESDGSAHLVRDHRGVEIGVFADLHAAFRALEASREPFRGDAVTAPRAMRRRPRRARV
ncbi:hypothetical protein [Microbacterium sp.]|uniref:hypothetical protein n=1 Tax=Microbacterium sp. TaxID=51671 RepID=UPI0039E38C9A